MRWLAALWVRHGVVDQIDNEIAALELENLAIVYVAVALLPAGVREGDVVRLRAVGLSVDNNRNAGRTRQRRHREE